MAEDIWQNLPYSVAEESVFLRGWPKNYQLWEESSFNLPIYELRRLRSVVNRVLEDCRSSQKIGAALESAIRIEPKENSLVDALEWLHTNGDPDVDCLRDWLLVSHLQFGGEPWAEVLASKETEIGTIEIAKARGVKCDRCWHYVNDVIHATNNLNICSRCDDILDRRN